MAATVSPPTRFMVAILILAGCENSTRRAPIESTQSSQVTPGIAPTPTKDPVTTEPRPPQLSPNDSAQPGSETHVWLRPYTKLDGTFVEGHWREKTPLELEVANRKKPQPEVPIVREPSTAAVHRKDGSTYDRPSHERESSPRIPNPNARFKESTGEKVYEILSGKEVVHRKDGTTYERKQRSKK